MLVASVLSQHINNPTERGGYQNWTPSQICEASTSGSEGAFKTTPTRMIIPNEGLRNNGGGNLHYHSKYAHEYQ